MFFFNDLKGELKEMSNNTLRDIEDIVINTMSNYIGNQTKTNVENANHKLLKWLVKL